jgi:F-type H+-transporting ATPase subunit b
VDINATLIGQVITFAVFVLFTMKYVWPPITQAMEERQKQIADGLAAGEQGKRDLELAEHKVEEMLTDAKAQAAVILEQAHHRANSAIEESKQRARDEGERLIKMAEDDVEQQFVAARSRLMEEVSDLTLASTRKVLAHAVTDDINKKLVDQLVGEL